MRLKLYYNSTVTPFDQYNLDRILKLLEALERQGIQCDRVDTARMSEEDIAHAYIEATLPTARRKYKVRQVFGSRRHCGFLFGKQVPALLVYNEGQPYPVDVFPHEIMLKEIKVEDYLERLLIGQKKG